MVDSNNVYKWFVSMAIVMVAMINSKNVVVNGQQVLSGKIDLIIMLAPLFEESQRNVYNRSVLKMIHDHVYISHQNVRIGFIDLGMRDTDKNVWLPLSGEFATIGPSLMQWSPGIKNGLHAGDAMQSCKSRACEFKKKDRVKVIVAHLHYYDDSDEPAGMEAAVNVRQLGAYLYFVTNADNPNRFADWTGSPARIFPMSKHERSVHTTLKMPEIVKAIEEDLCGFCRFNSPEQKECEWKRFEAGDPSYFGSDHAACAQLESSCGSAAECEWACNRQWSWEKNKELEYDCDQLECGQMRRNPILPPTTKVENCIAEIDCGKPECQTTKMMNKMMMMENGDSCGMANDVICVYTDINKTICTPDHLGRCVKHPHTLSEGGCWRHLCESDCDRFFKNETCNGKCGNITAFKTNLTAADMYKMRFCRDLNATIDCGQCENSTTTDSSTTTTTTTITPTKTAKTKEKEKDSNEPSESQSSMPTWVAAVLGVLGALFVLGASLGVGWYFCRRKKPPRATTVGAAASTAARATSSANSAANSANSAAKISSNATSANAASSSNAANTAASPLADIPSTQGPMMKAEFPCVAPKHSDQIFTGISTTYK